jgi:nicotinamide mononucleotide transporter
MEHIFGVDNIIFAIGGQGVSLIEILSVAAGLSCVYMATQRKVLNFWLGYLYNILLFWLFLQKGLYSSMLLQPVSFAINMFGHYRWTHPAKDEENRNKELKITLLSARQRIIFPLLIGLFVILWGTFLSNIHNLFPSVFNVARQPYLDSFVTGTILLAQYLSAQKKLECWAVWFTVNTTNIILYILAGLAFMPMVSSAYLILAFFGFAMWRRQWKNENI